MNTLTEYKACTNISISHGRTTISCKLGLWTVSSRCVSRVQREAQRYFNQYNADGEYSSIIGGKSVDDVFWDLLIKQG